MTDDQKKCSYNRVLIAEVYQCSQNDAELIKCLRIFISQNIDVIEQLVQCDEECKITDFLHKHLEELKHIFSHVPRE